MIKIVAFAYEESDINKIFTDLTKQKFNKIETKFLDNPFKDVDLNISQNIVDNKIVEIVDVNNTQIIIPKLIAIFNSRVKLDDKWLDIEDNISGFTILNINYNSIILGNKDENRTLSLIPENQVVRKSNEVQ